MGLYIKSVNDLNKIMEKIDLLIYYINDWYTTDVGEKLSMWHKGMLNYDA